MKRGGCDETDEVVLKKRKSSSYDEVTSTIADEEEGKSPKAGNAAWPEEDLLKLADNLESTLPKDDMISFNTRMERIDWTSVVFNNYSVEDCKQMWTSLHKHVRKFRLTKEIVEDVKLWIKKSKTKPTKTGESETKSGKHPDMPKQPPNSYLFYYQEQRHKIKRENPEFSCSDIAKLVGNQFNNLTSTQREKYEKQAAAAKEEYAGKIKEFYENHPECVPKKIRGKNSVPVANAAPAKPRTAFEIFFEYKMEQEEEEIESRYGFTQKCREAWRAMSKEDLIFWINWAEEEYKVYLENLKTFLLANPNFDPEPVKPTITKKERKIKEQCSGKPVKPPMTSFQLFSRLISQNEECKSLNGRDIMTFISMKWKNCSDEEKHEYQKRVDQMWEAYDADFNSYLETLPAQQRVEVLKEKVNRKIKQEIKEEVEDEVEERIVLKQPEVPPRTEFKYFATKYKGKDAKTAWEKLGEKNKEVIRAELRILKRKYIMEYEMFLKSMNPSELEEFAKNTAPTVPSDDETSSMPDSDSLIEETSESETEDE